MTEENKKQFEAPKGILKIIKGDATQPQGSKLRYIIQIVNNEGKYGKGFSGALSSRYPAVEREYRQWWRERYGKLKLGEVKEVQVASDLIVINMIAQNGIVGPTNPKPFKSEALQECLSKVAKIVSQYNSSVHCPKIGGGLSGANFEEEVLPIIEQELIKRGINVTVYEYD